MLPPQIEAQLATIRGEVELCGAELFDIQLRHLGGRSVLTLTVDKAGGVTLDECAKINVQLGNLFDRLGESAGWIGGSYTLEVNSPGLDRPLKTEKDFVKARGAEVRMHFRQADGRATEKSGMLESVESGLVTLRKGPDSWVIPIDAVIHAVRMIHF